MKPVEGLINRELINTLENSLGDLAALWRSRQSKPEVDEIVRQYQAILRCMIELGYHDSLDVDSEMPDEYLPVEYLTLHT